MAPDNVLSLHQVASVYGFEQIVRRTEQYILEHGYVMLRERSFLALSPQELTRFLTKDRFCTIEDEIALFMLRYIKLHHLEEDERQCEQLLTLVRFPMIVDMEALFPMFIAKGEILCILDCKSKVYFTI